MARPKLFNYLAAAVIVFLLGLYYYQSRYPSHVSLRLGEYVDKRFPVPVVAATGDKECSDAISCPSRIGDCIKRTFTVEKDTLYFLTVAYAGDSIHSTCMSCGSIYDGKTPVTSSATGCGVKGPTTTSVFLQAGTSYTLIVCLSRCSNVKTCACGNEASANAAVSLRKIY